MSNENEKYALDVMKMQPTAISRTRPTDLRLVVEQYKKDLIEKEKLETQVREKTNKTPKKEKPKEKIFKMTTPWVMRTKNTSLYPVPIFRQESYIQPVPQSALQETINRYKKMTGLMVKKAELLARNCLDERDQLILRKSCEKGQEAILVLSGELNSHYEVMSNLLESKRELLSLIAEDINPDAIETLTDDCHKLEADLALISEIK